MGEDLPHLYCLFPIIKTHDPRRLRRTILLVRHHLHKIFPAAPFDITFFLIVQENSTWLVSSYRLYAIQKLSERRAFHFLRCVLSTSNLLTTCPLLLISCQLSSTEQASLSICAHQGEVFFCFCNRRLKAVMQESCITELLRKNNLTTQASFQVNNSSNQILQSLICNYSKQSTSSV